MSNISQNESSQDEEQREPCPTPLLWQDIVLSFHEEMRQGPVAFKGGTVIATQFGSGPPLVFLPGTVASPRLYALTAWLLKEDRQCWLLDHPQFQFSPADGNLISASGSAYAEVLQDLFGRAVDVYASNYAVPVLLQMLLTQPERVNKGILQSGWGSRHWTWAEWCLLQLGKRFPFPLKYAPLWSSSQVQNHRPWFPPYDETRFSFLLSETSQTKVSAASSRLLAASSCDLTSRLSEIETSLLILRTEGDGKVLTEQQDILEKGLPNCQSNWLHTAGHYPYLTHPHRLVKILREFFQIPKTDPSKSLVSKSP